MDMQTVTVTMNFDVPCENAEDLKVLEHHVDYLIGEDAMNSFGIKCIWGVNVSVSPNVWLDEESQEDEESEE